MEKPAAAVKPSAKNRFLKFLPKAASAVHVTFQNPPFSPGRDNKRSSSNLDHGNSNYRTSKTHLGRGFSGPIIPMIPKEARITRTKSLYDRAHQEPTSPKVSCMGQVKHRRRISKVQKHVTSSIPKNLKSFSSFQELRSKPSSQPGKIVSSPPNSKPNPQQQQQQVIKKKPSSGSIMRSIFSTSKSRRKSDASADRPPRLPDRAPSLSQMKRFSSGRDSLSNFDWTTAQVAPDARKYYSDDDDHLRGGDSEGEEEEVIIPFSAPISLVRGGGSGGVCLEPRKEVNLWKRRPMSQPQPLQLNSLVISH